MVKILSHGDATRRRDVLGKSGEFGVPAGPTEICPACTATFILEPRDQGTYVTSFESVLKSGDHGVISEMTCPSCLYRYRQETPYDSLVKGH